MFDEQQDDSRFTPARHAPQQDATGVLDLAGAAMKSAWYVDNVTARFDAYEEAYDRRARAIKEATGQDIGDNPIRSKFLWFNVPNIDVVMGWRDGHVKQRLAALADQYPHMRDVIRPDVSITQDAEEIARRAEEHAADIAARYRGLPPRLAVQFAGGFGGSLSDPLNVSTFAVGPAGRVAVGAKSVLWMGVKQGAANAGVEALSQPAVQSWRRQAGLDYGFGMAATNVGAAFAFGFGLDAGVRGVARGIRRGLDRVPKTDAHGAVVGWRRSSDQQPLPEQAGPVVPAPADAEQALADAAAGLPPNAIARKAAAGDIDAMWRMAKQLGIDGEPEIRGAKMSAEIDAEFTARMRQAGAEDWRSMERLAAALRAAEEPDHFLPPAGVAVAPQGGSRGARGPDVEGDAIALARALRADQRALDGRVGAVPEAARSLARLAPDAFEEAAAGRVKGEIAALVGEHVPAGPRQGELMRELADLTPRSADEARRYLAFRLADPAQVETGAGIVRLPQAVAEVRAGVIDAAVQRLAKGLDASQESSLQAVLEAAAARAGAVSDAVADASRMVDAGTAPRQAGAMLEQRLRRLSETPPERAVEARGIDEPGGPEAQAQVAELERDLKGEIDDAKATLDGQPTRDDETMLAIRAFHGSPHDFERFDMSRLGTGEGAAAFGVGHNIASKQEVAVYYKNKLSPITSEEQIAFDPGIPKDQRDAVVAAFHQANEYMPGKVTAQIIGQILDDNRKQGIVQGMAADAYDQGRVTIAPQSGHVYTVEFNADEARLLDWDVPFEKQPANVIDAFKKASGGVDVSSSVVAVKLRTDTKIKIDVNGMDMPNGIKSFAETFSSDPRHIGSIYKIGDEYNAWTYDIGYSPGDGWVLDTGVTKTGPQSGKSYRVWQKTGASDDVIKDEIISYMKPIADANPVSGGVAYNRLAKALDKTGRRFGGDPKEASAALAKAGVPGIRFLDQFSRDIGRGSRNFIVFNDADIKIVAKNGQPMSEAERKLVLLAMRGSDQAAARAPTDAALLRAEHGLTPAAEMRSAELRREVERTIARIAPPGVKARIEERIHFRDREVDGLFDPHERLIHVALSAADPVRVATEEAGHALKASGLLTDQEYGLLWAHAQRHGLRKQYRIDEQYRPIYGARWKVDPDRLEAALREETIMKMLAAHAAGERFGGMVDRIVETVARVLAAIRDALGLKGFGTVHDVFRAIESGEVKSRAEPGADAAARRAELAPAMAEVDRAGEVKGVADACRG